jgi:glycosyltransferase involved in cell wall biosynthesis
MNTDTPYPLVSILINNYNYADFIEEAIDSALAQTYPNLEVIVVDDGSTDRSRSIIEGYGDRIMPILKANGGQASSFNEGFAVSRGEIICFLDSDDLFAADKIEKVVEIFKNHPDIGWCFHNLQLFTHEPTPVPPLDRSPNVSGVCDLRDVLAKGKLTGRIPFSGFRGAATSGMCFRRSFLEKLLPMPEEIRITSDDYLKYVAFALIPGYILQEELCFQRIHDNNAYTLRKDKYDLKVKITIFTAFWLKTNFPKTAKFANNIFAFGYSFFRSCPDQDPEVQSLIEKYLSSLSFWERAEINIRDLYYRLQFTLNSDFNL